jgi:exo-beta-1,3-glucanase (GH17 family)
VLIELVGQEKPNRWGYDVAHKAFDDDWRARARAAVARAIGAEEVSHA